MPPDRPTLTVARPSADGGASPVADPARTSINPGTGTVARTVAGTVPSTATKSTTNRGVRSATLLPGVSDSARASLRAIDEQHMKRALALAQDAWDRGEVPVGAVLVDATGRVLGEGSNRPIGNSDPTAHAEIVALRAACAAVGNYRLPGATLYVTLEPCAMCMGAMLHTRLSRVVFGAPDPKTGVCGGTINLPAVTQLNHQTVVEGGMLADECAALLRAFFRSRRDAVKARRLAEKGSAGEQGAVDGDSLSDGEATPLRG